MATFIEQEFNTLSDQELNAPGGMSTIDGGYMTGANNIPTPTAPVTSAPSQGTGGSAIASPTTSRADQLTSIQNQALSIQEILNQRQADEAVGSGYGGAPDYNPLDVVNQPEQVSYEQDKEMSYNEMLRLHQGEIDATNQVYDTLLNDARIQGQGRLGSTRAASARGGLLGSDFGASRKQGQIAANTAEQRGIQAERQAKIGNIMGVVRSSALAELQLKREARSADADAYNEYLSGRKERKANYMNEIVAGMLAQGTDINDFTEEELNEMGKEAGFKAADFTNAYSIAKAGSDAAGAEADLKTRKTEAEIAKINADIEKGYIVTIGEGTVLRDTRTGETFKNPKTYAPKTGTGTSSAFSSSDEQTLLGGGWSEADMSALDAGVRQYGLPEVIAKEKAGGATPEMISALNSAYGVKKDETDNQYVTKEFITRTYSPEKLAEYAKQAGNISGGDDWLPFNETGNVEAFLESLQADIDYFRSIGLTDKEIEDRLPPRG